MQKKPSRRKFIKSVGLTGLSAGIVPVTIRGNENQSFTKNKTTATSKTYNGNYEGQRLNRIAFPIGGLGAGMFCLEGTGAISHMSVRNRPEIFNEPGFFAAIHVKGINHGAKVIEGPVPDWKKFGQKDAGNGATGMTTGLPRFAHASFKSEFPFAHIQLNDPDIPIEVLLTGWSPFIPTDENSSGMPIGAIEYSFKNKSAKTLESIFSYNAKNFLSMDKGSNSIQSMMNGFILHEAGTEELKLPSSFAIFTDEPSTIDHCWFRGGWWDPMTMAWNAVKNGEIKDTAQVEKNAPGASMYIPFSLHAGQTKVIKLYFSWYTPESNLTFGKIGNKKASCDPASGCCNSPDEIGLEPYDQNFDGKFYKPWYSNRFKSIHEVCDYWQVNYDQLKSKTLLFKKAFYSTTLPAEVIEAVACNLSILKSPTVMRQYDGRLWSWEGCGDDWGCCHGSCTHVWNYAQAIAHIFPAMERSLRHTEFCESQSAEGHQTFRTVLPIQAASHDFHAAADGQLGGIMKAHREWRIYGDHEWLSRMYPMIKKSMDYCIDTWDPRHAGVIEEPHHNTYDIEFWGPDGMHLSFYLGALNAMIRMGHALKKDVSLYEGLLEKGKKYMEHDLYDGEYFIQNIQYKGLKAPNPADPSNKTFGGEYSDEAKALLDKEGPKYQYGKGCLSDGVLGAWLTRMCFMEDVIDASKLKSHLHAIHKYNYKSTLAEHANPQRPSFALGEEGGLLLCSWPKGGKLSLPFVYSDEVWTGIEHQVAAHSMMAGNLSQGLDILRASRDRYDGKVRNPFNEYECGHWYARAMSSYGYLQSLTGVRYDAVDKTLYVESKIGNFTSFLSTNSGFGTVTLKDGKVSYKVYLGDIQVEKIKVNA